MRRQDDQPTSEGEQDEQDSGEREVGGDISSVLDLDTESYGPMDVPRLDRAEMDTISMSTTVDVSHLDEDERETLLGIASVFEDSFRDIVQRF